MGPLPVAILPSVLFVVLTAARPFFSPAAVDAFIRDAGLEILLNNASNDTKYLSTKELITLSVVNRNLNDAIRRDPLYPFVQVLREEPCFSGGFAENSFYIPAGPRTPSNLENHGGKLLFVFNKWNWTDSKTDGYWWNGEDTLPFYPDFAAQSNIVKCLSWLIKDGLKVEIAADIPPPGFTYPLGDKHRPKITEPAEAALQDAKQWLLWLAIKNNLPEVIEFLISQQGTLVYWRHFVVAAQTRNEKLFIKLFWNHRNQTLDSEETVWDIYPWSYMFKFWEPSHHIIDMLLSASPLEEYDLKNAAMWGRRASLEYLISKAPEQGLLGDDFRDALVNTFKKSMKDCRLDIMQFLLDGEHDLDMGIMTKRRAFICAVLKEDTQKAKDYFYRFELEPEFRRWIKYLSQDESPPWRIRQFVKKEHDFSDDRAVTALIRQLHSWPVGDLESFRAVHILFREDGDDEDELSDTQKRKAVVLEIQRGNYNKARKLFKELGLDTGAAEFTVWAPMLEIEDLRDFFDVTEIVVKREDLHHLAHSYVNMEDTIEWLIEGLEWTEEDFDFFARLARECGPTMRSNLERAISQSRHQSRPRKRGLFNFMETVFDHFSSTISLI